ncbi:hypothetical protein SARC_03927 [Sphaeroforma arctica JP610]|uniref:Neurotransmitter-gated ion-channel ligand-binding domain-containing protein n=1 Tax=Sphaeroforma arctica JP610 TaxID=667725 RepID=A0A0L0G465_9EUKA|nr:hypothetical protein SARC_03927 [Sphaeroforma arctica JP610]KNC83845.1 hypothetical protein SARC_03927 [Sphaeroforma arctica JP610]|eukprot:XP_014157747.1 hypothetical protein SARC_03927 [Sphaeroforma arctica JP610]
MKLLVGLALLCAQAATAQREFQDIQDVMEEGGGGDADPETVGNVCSDPRASNYIGDGNTLSEDVDDSVCLHQIMSVEPGVWTSMPEYCVGNGFDWNNDEMTDCYDAAPRWVPPFDRDFSVANCTDPRDCTNPLEVHVVSAMVEVLKFEISEDTFTVSMVYAAKWKDPRLFYSLVRDIEAVWRPEFGMSATMTDRDLLPLPVISIEKLILDQRIYVSPPQCNAQDADLQANGQDVGCCNPGEECAGSLEEFASFVDCPSFDECWVQASQRIDATYRIGSGLDVADFPFDSHNVELALYLVNPFRSTDPDWWVEHRPTPPVVKFNDYQSNIPTTEGSLKYSIDRMDLSGWGMASTTSEKNSTALSYLMKSGQYQDVLARSHKYGVQAVTANINFSRWSAIVSRYNLFPMALIGIMTALTLIIDDDAVTQVSVRVGFGALAIFVSLEPRSLNLIAIAGSEKQITVVDAVSILTICLGGCVMIHAILSYCYWRHLDADPYKEWTCWKVRCMDRVVGLTLTLLYLYLFVLLVIIPQSTTATIVWGVTAGLISLAVWCVVGMYIYRWALKARIQPDSGTDSLKGDSINSASNNYSQTGSEAFRSSFVSHSRL